MNLDLGPQEGPTFATVAVVDEGILSLTRFQSPDPLKAAVRQARARRRDLRDASAGRCCCLRRAARRSTGGDEGGDGAGGRVQPVKPVALWSGLVQVPETAS